MEVLGSYAPNVASNVKEIRIRFSRVKFWLGVRTRTLVDTSSCNVIMMECAVNMFEHCKTMFSFFGPFFFVFCFRKRSNLDDLFSAINGLVLVMCVTLDKSPQLAVVP